MHCHMPGVLVAFMLFAPTNGDTCTDGTCGETSFVQNRMILVNRLKTQPSDARLACATTFVGATTFVAHRFVDNAGKEYPVEPAVPVNQNTFVFYNLVSDEVWVKMVGVNSTGESPLVRYFRQRLCTNTQSWNQCIIDNWDGAFTNNKKDSDGIGVYSVTHIESDSKNRDKLYRFIAYFSGTFTFKLCGVSSDNRISVYAGKDHGVKDQITEGQLLRDHYAGKDNKNLAMRAPQTYVTDHSWCKGIAGTLHKLHLQKGIYRIGLDLGSRSDHLWWDTIYLASTLTVSCPRILINTDLLEWHGYWFTFPIEEGDDFFGNTEWRNGMDVDVTDNDGKSGTISVNKGLKNGDTIGWFRWTDDASYGDWKKGDTIELKT